MNSKQSLQCSTVSPISQSESGRLDDWMSGPHFSAGCSTLPDTLEGNAAHRFRPGPTATSPLGLLLQGEKKTGGLPLPSYCRMGPLPASSQILHTQRRMSENPMEQNTGHKHSDLACAISFLVLESGSGSVFSFSRPK